MAETPATAVLAPGRPVATAIRADTRPRTRARGQQALDPPLRQATRDRATARDRRAALAAEMARDLAPAPIPGRDTGPDRKRTPGQDLAPAAAAPALALALAGTRRTAPDRHPATVSRVPTDGHPAIRVRARAPAPDRPQAARLLAARGWARGQEWVTPILTLGQWAPVRRAQVRRVLARWGRARWAARGCQGADRPQAARGCLAADMGRKQPARRRGGHKAATTPGR